MASVEPRPSPEFENPPVVETALSIQFQESERFTGTHFGQFHEIVRQRYPGFQDAPRLPRIAVVFPPTMKLPTFEVHGKLPVQRGLYLEADDGAALIQVQADRFGFNWRKRHDNSYPRYAANVQRFLREFHEFSEFAAANQLGVLHPDACEVVYVNQIMPREGERPVDLFGRVFSGIRWQHSTAWLPVPEAATLNRTYVIGENRGRLYAEASISRDENNSDFVALKMTARVTHAAHQQIAASLNLAHDWVVHGFVSLTDPDIRRERWGES